jgi:hypothetical protein
MYEKPKPARGETYDLTEGPDGAWRMEKEQASAKVDALVESIDGFDQMTTQEQISILKSELASLTDNADRHMAEPLSIRIKFLELDEEGALLDKKKASLGRVVDTYA